MTACAVVEIKHTGGGVCGGVLVFPLIKCQAEQRDRGSRIKGDTQLCSGQTLLNSSSWKERGNRDGGERSIRRGLV